MDACVNGRPLADSVSVAGNRPIRLLTLTTLFPNGAQPRHGIFVANRLRRLCDTGRINAAVVAAVPWFPGAYRDRAAIPARENVLGFDVRHPRYVNVPAIGMRIQPDSLARALLDDLRSSGVNADSFDLVDAHYFYPDGVAAARVADELGLPLVITARGSDINSIGEIAFARQRMLRAADRAGALIAVSRALAQRMIELGMPRERTHVIRNGVDTNVFAPFPRAEARKRLGLREGRWVLGVGNLVPEKGFDLLIRAVSALQDTRLLIVGEGPLRRDLVSLARKLAPDRIEFRDNVPQAELRFVYSAGDVLALPSLREGWPNVILEAIACGTPVVASAVGGVSEIMGNDAVGLLVTGHTVDAWQGALDRALCNGFLSERLRRHALKFGWDEVVTHQCALYESIVTTNASKPLRYA
jgi:glycosyltransferase involved in cell wall biosynthesis